MLSNPLRVVKKAAKEKSGKERMGGSGVKKGEDLKTKLEMSAGTKMGDSGSETISGTNSKKTGKRSDMPMRVKARFTGGREKAGKVY